MSINDFNVSQKSDGLQLTISPDAVLLKVPNNKLKRSKSQKQIDAIFNGSNHIEIEIKCNDEIDIALTTNINDELSQQFNNIDIKIKNLNKEKRNKGGQEQQINMKTFWDKMEVFENEDEQKEYNTFTQQQMDMDIDNESESEQMSANSNNAMDIDQYDDINVGIDIAVNSNNKPPSKPKKKKKKRKKSTRKSKKKKKKSTKKKQTKKAGQKRRGFLIDLTSDNEDIDDHDDEPDLVILNDRDNRKKRKLN